MPSQFFGLTIAGSGLRNSNANLNTTANNISNVQTKGYSRQEVSAQAADALRTFATYGCAGAGVETIAIERVRDSFYDVKYWNNNANYGQFETKSYYMKSIEDYFKDDGATGFVTVFNKMSDALQSLSTNSSSTSTKAQFVASANAFTDYFNGLYGNLQKLQADINLEIKQCVDQINSVAEQIATLNKQINVIELSGSKANDLRDQRDLLVDTLSEYVDVRIEENPIYDTNDPTRETGGSRYVVRIAGGQILVDSNDFSKLRCEPRANDEKVYQTDIDGLYDIYWEDANFADMDKKYLNSFDLNNAALNGKLKGLYELRDGNNTSNFNGKVSDVTGNTVTIDVDAEYLKGLTDCNLPSAGGTIVISNSTYYYDTWSYEETGGKSTYKFVLDSTKGGLDLGMKPKAGDLAFTKEPIKYEGIPYYMTQMDSFLRSFTHKINSIFESGCDAYNNYGEKVANLFTCEIASGELTKKQLNGDDLIDPGIPDGYYYMTCGNVKINTALLNDADLLGTRTDPTFGVEECGKVEEAISALSNKSVYSFRNASANQMLELILSDVALNASNANIYTTTYEGLKNTIDNQRTSISGVDEDEEAVNLVKFQNAYTLASKMIQTLTEIYDQLILNTGV